jgi:hypothetical protein
VQAPGAEIVTALGVLLGAGVGLGVAYGSC